MSHEVTFIPGDTTGPEIFAQLKPFVTALGVDIAWDEPGQDGPGTHEAMLASAARTGCILMAFEKGDRDHGKLAPIVALRKECGVYANIRPIKNLPHIEGRHDDVDLIVVRETTEDIYANLEHTSLPGVFESLKVTTEAACERIARHAFELARRHGRKKVTIVHKSNIMKLSDGMFLRVGQRVAQDYPDVAVDECIVDALCMKLIINPAHFDVLLCGNLFGDIVSDLCTGLVGGLSNAVSINLAPETAIFTTGHGDPSELVGTGRANPLTLLLPTLHMLRHLGEHEASARGFVALAATLGAGVRPVALGGETSLEAFFVALAKHLPTAAA